MRLSRTDLVPMLAIIGGGAVSVLISGSPVLWSPSDDVPASVHPVWSPDEQSIVFEADEAVTVPMRVPATPVISPDGQWISRSSPRRAGEPRFYVRRRPAVTDPQKVPPLVYIDGVRVETSFFESLNPDDIERIEVVKGDAAVALYGEEASSGAIQIFLKEARHRR